MNGRMAEWLKSPMQESLNTEPLGAEIAADVAGEDKMKRVVDGSETGVACL